MRKALIKGTRDVTVVTRKSEGRAVAQNPTWSLISYAKVFRRKLFEAAPHLKDPIYKLLVASIVDAEMLHVSVMRGLKRDGLLNESGDLRPAVAEARQQLRMQLAYYAEAGLTPKSKIDIAELARKVKPSFDIAKFRAETLAEEPETVVEEPHV